MRSPAYSPPDGLQKDDLEYDIAAPRVYCFITRFPFFQLHFNTIYHLLGEFSLRLVQTMLVLTALATIRIGAEEQHLCNSPPRSVHCQKEEGESNHQVG